MDKSPSVTRTRCSICEKEGLARVASVTGIRTGQDFHIRYCADCGFAWVDNPWMDFATVYDEAYYLGKGSDPLVKYVDELESEATIRQWEWQGILQWADDMRGDKAKGQRLRWLDFGCGNGGLVRYVQKHASDRWEIEGFEEGWAAGFGREKGCAILTRDELSTRTNSYDLVTAVEVLEHTVDPRETLREVRSMLRPGGEFLYTTGNLEPYTHNIPAWRYVRPEIHVSYFEPRALARLLEQTGFEARNPGYRLGHTAIIGYKVLKGLKQRQLKPWMYLLPWPLLSRVLNARLKIFAHPMGVAR
ncbi:MAG: class I SAM-dependent methyltransferase [Candidatus Methylacidiphilales bacterium]|nr:class I SAM-dependent methyltransferase [Candidatus Methylacidiphilales bacterium]